MTYKKTVQISNHTDLVSLLPAVSGLQSVMLSDHRRIVNKYTYKYLLISFSGIQAQKVSISETLCQQNPKQKQTIQSNAVRRE